MNFSFIFIFYFVMSFLCGLNAEIITASAKDRKDSLDIRVESPEMELLATNESPEEIDDIIRQRRKAIEELLNNFRQDMKREQESVNDKRSIHLKNQKFSNHWTRADNGNIKNHKLDRHLQEFRDEGNVILVGGPSFNNSKTSTESTPENLKLNKMEERTHNKDAKNASNSEQEDIELLKNTNKNNRKQSGQVEQNQDSSRGKGPLPGHSIKADYFNAGLQDYDDEEDHFTIGEKSGNNYENSPNFENSKRLKNSPYTCCLCDDCKPLDAEARNYIFHHYMKSNAVKPTESHHLTGARDKDEFASFKYPVGEQDVIKTIQLKSFENVPHHDIQMQIENGLFIDPYAGCANNLSHEANYKLSKLEQDPVENQKYYKISKLEQDHGEKRNNFSWLWPNWGLQKRRSLQFNPMNEIKLKTSSRLMQRGFGPSLPSYSLGENRREYMIDNILKRKELEFHKGNGKYHELGEVMEVADPAAELNNSEGWNDFEISEAKPNAVTNDWNHVRRKRISENQRFKEENEEKALRDHQKFKGEENEKILHNNLAAKRTKIKPIRGNLDKSHTSNTFRIPSQQITFTNDFEALKHFDNTNHRSKRSKRSINAICPKERKSNSIRRQHHMTKRNAPLLKDPYEDYNSFHDFRNLNANHYQDLMDNDLENLNKDAGSYKARTGHNIDFNKNLYKRQQHEGLQQLDQNIKFNKWQDHNHYLRRDVNNLKFNKTGYMDMGNYLSIKQPSDNYLNLKPELNSKWNENRLRQKKFARVPQRQPKRKKGNSNRNNKVGPKVDKGRVNPLDRDSNRDELKSASLNMYNLNKFDKFHDLTNKNWPRHVYKHYPDLRHRSDAIGSRNNTNGFSSTNTTKLQPETSSVTSNDESRKISLEFRNEILNCTAFSNLKEFLKSLPSNITKDLMGTATTEDSEEIEMEFTTLDIKELTTENPAWTTTDLPVTQESYTEMEDTTDFESSKAPETWEAPTLDYSDITESPNSTAETTEADVEASNTPITDDNDSSWDDSLSGNTCSPKSLPSSSLGPGSDDVKLNITINANVAGNSKNKNFNGNGTINVKPGFGDNRFGRRVQKRKCSPRPSINGYDEDLFNDLASGKLSGNIVKAVFDEVQENPDLQVLWPSLERNQLSERTPLPFLYSIRDKDNDDKIQHSQNLMAKTMDSINNIIDQEVRSRSCVVLRPDLQEFYDLIVKSNQLQEGGREKREDSREKPVAKFHKSIPNVEVDKTKTVKKLLRQYEELSQQEQQEVKPIRDILLSELSTLESRRDAQERQTRAMKENRNLGEVPAHDDITKLLKKYYTPQFLKLQKAADLYRSITNEIDDGLP